MEAVKPQHIRVRMAPSPTGSLHIGGVRTALYNMLFARKNGGTFVLRIEDTDEERSTKEFEKDILESFAWAGVIFDEGVMPDGSQKGEYGPYRQTECLDSYEKHLQTLLTENKAYYCFCSKEELEAQAQSQMTSGQAPKYSGKCRTISHEESSKRISAGEKPVIRLKVAAEKVSFTDLIRGEVVFDNGLIGDIVIAKSLRQPLYNFAVVIDDMTMKISHVIRGEEHLANTPKQIAIAQALGIHSPRFAHLPIILSATGKGKMSKRDGGTTVREYKEAGYLPEALLNFLVLLGWHPSGDEEVLTMEQMVSEFSLERVQKGGAKFNKEKLDWFNNFYLRKLDDAGLLAILKRDYLPALIEPLRLQNIVIPEDAQLLKMLALVKERMKTLTEFNSLIAFFIKLPDYAPHLLVWKKGTPEAALTNLREIHALLEEIPEAEYHKAKLDERIMPVAEAKGKGDVLWPLRVALSGSEFSPSPTELLDVLGKHESLLRIDLAIGKLQTS